MSFTASGPRAYILVDYEAIQNVETGNKYNRTRLNSTILRMTLVMRQALWIICLFTEVKKFAEDGPELASGSNKKMREGWLIDE